MNQVLLRRKILTYALISANFAGRRDPVSALYPLLAPIALDRAGQAFDAGLFRQAMSEMYGMALTRDVVELFVQRLGQQGLVKGVGPQAIWVAPPGKKIESTASDQAMLESVLERAKVFHASKSDLLTTPFDENNFLEALMRVVLDSHAAVQRVMAATNGEVPAPVEAPRIKDADQYFASSFIRWTKEKDARMFTWIAELGGAAIVAESLVELRSPSLPAQVSADLTVYLDTPFLMELLGCSGKAAREDAKFIHDQLKIQRIKVSALRHSIDELRDNLRAVLKTTPGQRTGPSASALLFKEVTEQQLNNVLDDPDYYINESGVSIVDVKNKNVTVDKNVFTDDDEQNFFANILTAYKHMGAAEKDAASVAWVMRRRKGDQSRDVLKAKHVLLTRNQMIYRRINKFCLERGYVKEDRVGPVILARDLAGVLWLLSGSTERAQISQRQLLLSCQRAQSNAPEVVNTMIDLLREVNATSADLFMIAVNKPAYLSLALDTVAGSGTGVTPAIAENTLERIREDLVSDERAKAKTELRKTTERFETDANLKEVVIQSLNSDLGKLETANDSHLEAWRVLSQREWLAQSNGARLSWLVLVGGINIAVVILTGLVVVVCSAMVPIAEPIKVALGIALVILAAVLTFVAGQRFIRDRVERLYQRKYEFWLRTTVPAAVVEQAEVSHPMISGGFVDMLWSIRGDATERRDALKGRHQSS
jgi:hypothetical protein